MMFHFITYANEKYKEKQNKLCRLVGSYNEYERVKFYSEEWLRTTKFFEENQWVLYQERGGGYWLWKPYVILETLKEIPEGDVVVYLDCGDVIKEGLSLYLESVLEKEPCLLLCGGYPQKHYTKRDCFHYMNCDEPTYHNVIQLEAGFQAWKRCEKSIEVLEEQIKFGKDYKIITDTPNKCGLPNYDGFVDHRHDQSILTNLAVKHQLPIDHPSQNTYKHARSYVTCNIEL